MTIASPTLQDFDPELAQAMRAEAMRQEDHAELIASENYASPLVMAVQDSVFTNKYAEGYPAAATTAVASTWTWPNAWRWSGSRRCSTAITPTSSRMPAPRPTRPCSWR